jgi:AraC-like DNA-binding protein
MELHTYGTNEGRIWESYWVSFKACGEIVQIWEKLLPPLQNIKDGTLLGCAMRIRELYMQNAAPELYTAALFTIMSILRRPQEPESMLKTDTVIENIHNYIIENIDKDLSLDEIAEKSGYSTTHLARLFKKRYGMAVNDYIINRRIANAQMLLAATQLSIKDISLKVGIADPLYFSRIFRKKLRICPSDFRRFYRGQ